ncbi:MAG: hypothetical protein CMO55_25065 [Verrucomicrobiales bacterium]|nr:hypothetical protein [Verrucomicrobiales bacterium]
MPAGFPEDRGKEGDQTPERESNRFRGENGAPASAGVIFVVFGSVEECERFLLNTLPKMRM